MIKINLSDLLVLKLIDYGLTLCCWLMSFILNFLPRLNTSLQYSLENHTTRTNTGNSILRKTRRIRSIYITQKMQLSHLKWQKHYFGKDGIFTATILIYSYTFFASYTQYTSTSTKWASPSTLSSKMKQL